MTRDELRTVVARAIAACRGGDPETPYDGAPVWVKALPDADAALSAIEGEHVIVPKDAKR